MSEFELELQEDDLDQLCGKRLYAQQREHAMQFFTKQVQHANYPHAEIA
jgi:hypothetical protein